MKRANFHIPISKSSTYAVLSDVTDNLAYNWSFFLLLKSFRNMFQKDFLCLSSLAPPSSQVTCESRWLNRLKAGPSLISSHYNENIDDMELEYGKGELSTSPFPISNIQSPKVWNGATTPKLDLRRCLHNGNVTSYKLNNIYSVVAL